MKILYEHSDFFIVSKQISQEYHGDRGVIEELRKERPCFGVHRLDRDTSGLMLMATNKESQSAFSIMFAQRKMKKSYLALSIHKPSKKQGTVKGDLVKSRGGSYKLTRGNQNPSVTKFQSQQLDKGMRLFNIQPLTGKTHQIRVVLKSLGSPILGDPRYGKESSDRMYLHSYLLSFEYKQESFCFVHFPTEGELFIHYHVEIKRQLADSLQNFSKSPIQYLSES